MNLPFPTSWRCTKVIFTLSSTNRRFVLFFASLWQSRSLVVERIRRSVSTGFAAESTLNAGFFCLCFVAVFDEYRVAVGEIRVAVESFGLSFVSSLDNASIYVLKEVRSVLAPGSQKHTH
jgi:hypothetical protein